MSAMVMLGVDVSKEKLDCGLWQPQVRKWHARKVPNQAVSARALVSWVQAKAHVEPGQIRVVLEATGPYHEEVAEAFYAAGCQVVVANPARVRDYAKGLGQWTKTDRIDARLLARYGIEDQKFLLWAPPPEEVRVLRALITRLGAVEQDLQREKNRLEKGQATSTPDFVLQSLQRGITALSAERERLLHELDDHIDRHPGLKQDRDLLLTIPGVADATARRLIGLLRGRTFQSARQAAAYVGLSVVITESGTSVRGAARLSKHGDSRIRASLYFPAVCASRHNQALNAVYKRLQARHKTKMSALGAIMRKLVHIAYGVLKHQMPYNDALVTKGV